MSSFNIYRLAFCLVVICFPFSQVLRFWYESTIGLTVRDVVDRVHEWLKEDIVDREVWNSVQDLIDFDPPALPPPPLSLSAAYAKKRKQVSAESKFDIIPLLKVIWRASAIFVGPLKPLIWTCSDVCPEFQSQRGPLTCVLPWIHLRCWPLDGQHGS